MYIFTITSQDFFINRNTIHWCLGMWCNQTFWGMNILASLSCIYWVATQIKPLFHKVKVFRQTQRKQEYYSPQLELFLCISCSRFCSWRQKNNAASFYHLYFKIYDVTAHPEAMFTDTPRFFELTGLTMSGMQDLYHIFLQGFFQPLSQFFILWLFSEYFRKCQCRGCRGRRDFSNSASMKSVSFVKHE